MKEQEAGVPVADLCHKHGVSYASIYKWKAKYRSMDVSEARRLKAIEEENARLKMLLADSTISCVSIAPFPHYIRQSCAANSCRRRSRT